MIQLALARYARDHDRADARRRVLIAVTAFRGVASRGIAVVALALCAAGCALGAVATPDDQRQSTMPPKETFQGAGGGSM